MLVRWIFILLFATVSSARQTITSKSRKFPSFLLVSFLLTAPAVAQVQPLTAWWIDTGDTDSTWLGAGMAPLGDINMDGYDDFIVSANCGYYNGNLYAYYGSSQPDTVPDRVIPSPNPALQWFGFPLFSVGDVNGDGYLDFIAPGVVRDTPRYRSTVTSIWAAHCWTPFRM